MNTIDATHFLHTQAALGEGPIWDSRRNVYWWIDIVGKQLFRLDPSTKTNDQWNLNLMPGTVVVRESGGLMLATQDGFQAFDIESGRLATILDPEANQAANRFNDGKCDPAGRFWAGTMRIENHMEIATGALYSLDRNHSVVKHLDDVGVSNGIVWSQDATRMYYADSPKRTIFGFDYDLDSGHIRNRQTVFFADDEMGFPDGMAIDRDDKLWVAFWDGWCVAQICPNSGKVLTKIALPVAQVTACAFGGRDHSQLLITTAAVGLDTDARASQPLAGDLFVANPNACGLAQPRFVG